MGDTTATMREFVFSSVLPATRYEELAELMFFNRQQQRLRTEIVEAIERYGMPEIVRDEQGLRFAVGSLGAVQALYALDGDAARGRLAGVMLYARVAPDKVVLLHIGVASEYTSGGRQAYRLLTFRLVQQLRRISRTIKGVTVVEILYGGAVTQVRSPAASSPERRARQTRL